MTNLRREGIRTIGCLFVVGNVMIDALMRHKVKADRSTILEDLTLESGR